MNQTCDPMHARAWFNWREPINWSITIVAMAILFLILVVILPVWLALPVALIVATLLFFFVLDRRTISVVCPNQKCGKTIDTDTPWKCGFCGAENFDTDNFSILGRCSNEKCKAKVKAYECHHCHEPIYFTKDRQKEGTARCVVAPVKTAPEPVKKDGHESNLARKRKDLQLIELDVQQAEAKMKLKGFNDVLEPPKPKSARERLRSRVGGKTELDDEVRKMEAEAREKFKDDSVALEKELRTIRDEARELLP